MRAVRGTTGIEGTELTEKEIEDVLESPPTIQPLGAARDREAREVRNARAAMGRIVELLTEDSERPITEDLIKQIHDITTNGIDYPHNIPGHYRDHGVSAGDYVAPAAAEVPSLMATFVSWFRSGPPAHWPAPVRAIAAHFYLISIHPFGDGNGRTSRAIESLLLYQAGVNLLGFYSLSNFYYRRRPEYVQALDRARFLHDGDLTEFVTFALTGLEEELQYIQGEVVFTLKKIAFRDYAREHLQNEGGLRSKAGERRLALVLSCINEGVNVSRLKARKEHTASLYADMTDKTISRDINFLLQQRLVHIEKGMLHANLVIMDRFIV